MFSQINEQNFLLYLHYTIKSICGDFGIETYFRILDEFNVRSVQPNATKCKELWTHNKNMLKFLIEYAMRHEHLNETIPYCACAKYINVFRGHYYIATYIKKVLSYENSENYPWYSRLWVKNIHDIVSWIYAKKWLS